MFHASQVDSQSTTHGKCPSADSDPRMRQLPTAEHLASVASVDTAGVFILDQERYDRQQNVAALHQLNTVIVEFDDTLSGLMQKKQFEVGCEPGNGEAQVDYSSETHETVDGILHRIKLHYDNDSPARLQAKGAERIIDRRGVYPNRDDKTRLGRVTAYLLMKDGLGHVETFPTGTRQDYDEYIANLSRVGVDYIRFTDGFHPCVMTSALYSNEDTLSDVAEATEFFTKNEPGEREIMRKAS
jgi:hypothetical protein